MLTVKDLEQGTAVLLLRRDMFKDDKTFEDILTFLNLNKENDLIKIQIDEFVRYEWLVGL